ncbi:MAG: nitroreductase family protein [Acidobacteriota bacterium]|nr:nitroreductase family protein [Acidobacteriota bacterium]
MNRIMEGFIPLKFDRHSDQEMIHRAKAYYELMNRRRTVREFSTDPVPMEVIADAVRTASSAPSGAHLQPWFFAVITDPKVKREIRVGAEKEEIINYERRFPEEWKEDLAVFGTDQEKGYLEDAPVLIVVFRQNYRLVDGERKKNYYVQESVGIASGMLIAALHNAGLATLTHTPNPMGFLNSILDRPKNESPVLLIPVGFPKQGTRVPDLVRKPLDAVMKIY